MDKTETLNVSNLHSATVPEECGSRLVDVPTYTDTEVPLVENLHKLGSHTVRFSFEDSYNSQETIATHHLLRKDELCDSDRKKAVVDSLPSQKMHMLPSSGDSCQIFGNASKTEAKVSSSEYVIRASAMRNKIEEKITEIEKKINLPNSELHSESLESISSPPDYNMIQVLDARRSRSLSVSELRQSTIDRLQSNLEKAEKVLCALNFFAAGDYQKGVGGNTNIEVSQQSVSRCIAAVSVAMSTHLLQKYVMFPRDQSVQARIKEEFYQYCALGGVIGAIDCTHVAIIAPPNDASHQERNYFNRKGFHSMNVQLDLELREEEVAKLRKIRDEVGSEIEDLTASLFEEANNIAKKAHMKQQRAERIAKEANMKLAMLQDEVGALKAIVEASNVCSPPIDSLQVTERRHNISHRQSYEVDPIFNKEYIVWRQNPSFNKEDPFLKRIYEEDIFPCLNFANKELAKNVLSAIEEDKMIIEKIHLNKNEPLPKTCALMDAPRLCPYKMYLDGQNSFNISALSRNRITAICDLFCYFRYLQKGLITSSIHEVYLEILKKRRRITSAKLGLIDDILE